MAGLDLTRSEWAALAAVAYLVVRVLGALSLVVWWYLTDSLRRTPMRLELSLITGVAVAVMCVAGLSIATDWPARGVHIVIYIAAAIAGLILGVMFDMVVSIRMWRIAGWLMSLRVPRYREQLLHGDAEVRTGAAKRLALLGLYARPARPELLGVVRGDASADVRTAAALAILYSIPDPPDEDADLANEFRAPLTDADSRVRTIAAAVQTTFHTTPAAELLPILCEGLKTEDQEIRNIAANALGRLGPEAAPAIPNLKEAALDTTRENYEAPEALGKIGEPAIPALIEILERGELNNRVGAADALGQMGPPARVALPALRKASTNGDEFLSMQAKRAIKQLGGEIA